MSTRRKRRCRTSRRSMVGLLLGIIVAIMVAPFSGLLLVSGHDTGVAHAQQGNQDNPQGGFGANDPNPRSEFWRAVRQGDAGYSAVSGPEANVLINSSGENWRAFRNGPLATYGVWILGAAVVACLLVLLIRGSIKIEGGRSGLTVPRWNLFERVLHWYVAILFLFLMVTGLSLLYGRAVLIPLIGKDAFAAFANLCKILHNYLGPFFGAGLLIMILIWLKDNLPKKIDFVWFAKGGGILSKDHASAGRVNGGEKAWYWVVVFVGLTVVVTGLVMNFPQYGQTRGQMQLAHLIHVGSAMIVSAVFLGHWYIATIGTEGTLEGMVDGRVDEQWAKQHHDLWVEELRERGITGERNESLPGGAQTRST